MDSKEEGKGLVRANEKVIGDDRDDEEDEIVDSNFFLHADTLYKKKKDKVRPVNRPHSGGLKPEGDENWKETIALSDKSNENESKYSWIIPKFSSIPRGQRLTQERLDRLKIGEKLTIEEKEALFEVLFNREAEIDLDFSEKVCFKREIELPHIIPTI